MLEQTDLSQNLSKAAYKAHRKALRRRLFELEETAFERKLPSIIVFEGWNAAGKGGSIREITRRLDPRGFKVYNTQPPRTLERKRPWLWRFWMQIPRYGQMAIFDESWYRRVTIDRVEKYVPIPEWIRAYEEINNFERTLADDGTIIIKFFLHISEKRQLKRFIKLSKDFVTAWQISKEDWERHRKYNEYLMAYNDMLENTSSSHAPWHMIPANNPHYRMFQVYAILINKLEDALGMERTGWDLSEPEAPAVGEEAAEEKAESGS